MPVRSRCCCALPSQSSDLVLSNIKIPAMNAIQFIQFLSGLADPPRLALMSVAEGRILASAKLTAQSPGVNVVAVLRKPVQASEVAALLADLISFPQPRRPRVFQLDAEPEGHEWRRALADEHIRAWSQPRGFPSGGSTVATEALTRWVTEHAGLLLSSRGSASPGSGQALHCWPLPAFSRIRFQSGGSAPHTPALR